MMLLTQCAALFFLLACHVANSLSEPPRRTIHYDPMQHPDQAHPDAGIPRVPADPNAEAAGQAPPQVVGHAHPLGAQQAHPAAQEVTIEIAIHEKDVPGFLDLLPPEIRRFLPQVPSYGLVQGRWTVPLRFSVLAGSEALLAINLALEQSCTANAVAYFAPNVADFTARPPGILLDRVVRRGDDPCPALRKDSPPAWAAAMVPELGSYAKAAHFDHGAAYPRLRVWPASVEAWPSILLLAAARGFGPVDGTGGVPGGALVAVLRHTGPAGTWAAAHREWARHLEKAVGHLPATCLAADRSAMVALLSIVAITADGRKVDDLPRNVEGHQVGYYSPSPGGLGSPSAAHDSSQPRAKPSAKLRGGRAGGWQFVPGRRTRGGRG